MRPLKISDRIKPTLASIRVEEEVGGGGICGKKEERKKGRQQGREEGRTKRLRTGVKQASKGQSASLEPDSATSSCALLSSHRISFGLPDRFHPPGQHKRGSAPLALRQRIKSVVFAAQTMQISPTYYSGEKSRGLANGFTE